ncbi:hypothetical protein NRI_0092 [Neorickettsia risticii str. Illinois]|uniref:Uncharacterized protein n=1 Tax=Neorickettsia risticii (strain Illinois) TaxID=434131 RepID=C6V3X3_NEORI|nr:hypothetical protein NRI_0092 [Neorickettsia risticii str. Illinois]
MLQGNIFSFLPKHEVALQKFSQPLTLSPESKKPYKICKIVMFKDS